MVKSLITSYIKKDYKSLEKASILFDMLQFVSDNDTHDEIFTLLKDALLNFSNESVLSFAFKLLKPLGYPMDLKPNGNIVKGFNIKTASIIYKKIAIKLQISMYL